MWLLYYVICTRGEKVKYMFSVSLYGASNLHPITWHEILFYIRVAVSKLKLWQL